MTIFPTGYPDKGSADSTDKVWASDGVTNFNITVDEIGNEVFIDRSTTDLPEGTNEYYTEAKVSANTTVVALGNDKADKSNVLELDNTTVYTPTLDYHPSTKKYVDDLGTNINGLTEESGVTNGDEFIYYNGSENVKVDFSDLSSAISTNISSDFVAVDKYVGITASATQQYLDTTEHIGASGVDIFVGEFTVYKEGTLRISYELGIDGTSTGRDVDGYVQKSTGGAAYTRVSTVFEVDGDVSGNSYEVSPDYDIACAVGDKFRIEGVEGLNNPAVKVTNIRVSFTRNIVNDINPT